MNFQTVLLDYDAMRYCTVWYQHSGRFWHSPTVLHVVTIQQNIIWLFPVWKPYRLQI